ncbi:MAG TPA: hypothetical protein DEA50_16445 [Parvularcula sp.]|nr:hypothetical protein [Parvularcula sp.]
MTLGLQSVIKPAHGGRAAEEKTMIQTIDRRRLAAGLGAVAILAAAPALAAPKKKKEIAAFSNGRSGDRANEGYDVTAYFTQGAARPGAAEVESSWKSAIWRFENAEARAKFETAPEAFAPQFGGYCTNAMSMKKIVPANPAVWRIKDGKLYLFAAKAGAVKFDKDPDAMIAKAGAYWKTLKLIG